MSRCVLTRHLSRALVALLALGAVLPAWAQSARLSAADTPMPYYSAADALQGLYGAHLPPRLRAFARAAEALARQAEPLCLRPDGLLSLRSQWQAALQAWEQLATPAVGPLLAQRSQRQIDFWPVRPELITRALMRAPQNLADMERVGTPAKGFPAMDHLLARWNAGLDEPARDTGSCRLLGLMAEGIVAEARRLAPAYAALAVRDWSETPEDNAAVLAEWVNQWLGALEQLRWTQIEKPLRAAQTRQKAVPRHARERMEDNVASWQRQWQALQAQAVLTPAQRRVPPRAAEGVIPLQALLLGRGQIVLAQRWGRAVAAADAAMDALTPDSDAATLLAAAQALKDVGALFQQEVAGALDIPLGFSDADGD